MRGGSAALGVERPAGPLLRQRADIAAPGVAILSASITRSRPAADLEVAIPAFNEHSRLPRTLRRTVEFLAEQPYSSRVVIVDNGSSDDTVAAARAIALSTDPRVPVDVVGCARPGKGAAVRRALLSSRSRYVGFFDADLATPVETLAAAMAALDDGAAAAIASRHHPDSELAQRQPLTRRVGGAAFRALSRGLVPGIRDTQCGFKFFQREAVTAALVQCRTTGFSFDVELLWRLYADGGRIVELPVVWTDDEQSTFRPLQDGVASFGALLQVQKLRQS
ncbi:Glycosyl transferase family 2 [Modestobacter italicus]|uniref:Glycosyl transferase family 2 n=1 Tax=Modestobacter italicus (strain DSM 44449 / CECT 9708 / BC 501) TaxID=2732864 RepID=I4ER75_MODI5|nr:Glycosyl transferase family 2 [Modestobacter marinus]